MIEPPRGMYPARVDDKGRLKLPVAFQQYFAAVREKTLFVTSLDGRIAQVYTLHVWRQNEKFFETNRENSKAIANVAFRAADLGSETEMDSQGRILLSPELRRELKIENCAVHVYSYRGRIQVLSEDLYQQKKREAAETAQTDLEALEAAGLS
jgi:MraZ protein